MNDLRFKKTKKRIFKPAPVGAANKAPSPLADFRRRGYAVIPGLVPREDIDRALFEINRSLGSGIDPAKLQQYNQESFCPELRTHEVLLKLFPPEVFPFLKPILPVESCQIAIRFPSEANQRNHPHIDGIPQYTRYRASKNVFPRPNQIFSFDCLVGVFLSDQTKLNGGNLMVYPGTHLQLAKYFKKWGLKKFVKNGIPQFSLPEPAQVRGEIGDVVLCNYSLLHTFAPNASPHPRYMVYFRVGTQAHSKNQLASLSRPWRNWRPVDP